MLGGHGTAIAWAPLIASGPVSKMRSRLGSFRHSGSRVCEVVGGPLARFLVERYGLKARTKDAPDVGVHYGEPQPHIDYFSFLHAILAIHVCGVLGILVYQWLTSAGFNLPLFVPVS